MILALDTETSALHPDDGAQTVILAAAWRTPRGIRSRAWATPYATNPDWPKIDVEAWRQLAYRIAAPEHQLVWHNAKFDLLHLWSATRGLLVANPAPKTAKDRLRPLIEALVEHTTWDTMVAHKLIEGSTSAALKEIAKRLWGVDTSSPLEALDEWFASKRQKTKPRYDQVPWEIIERYARQDVKLTLRLYEYQQAVLEETGDVRLERLIEREFEFMKLLFRMEMRGIRFDADASRDGAAILREEMARLEALLPFRATLPAAKHWFFEVEGLQPHSYTKSGAPGLTERDVDMLAKAEVPHADTLSRHQALKSAVSKWYGAWPQMLGEDGRLRTVFGQTNVRSMRLAVSRVQLQAIPHIRHFAALGFDQMHVPLPRELFLAKRDHELWECDLSQGEVRIAAAVAECQAMREIVSRPGADVHGDTCARVFRIDKSAPDWKMKRDIAKRVTFGTIYGAGAKTLKETILKETGIEVTMDEMLAIIQTYRDTFPEFFRFARRASLELEERGYITLITGKRRYFNLGPPLWEKAHTAFNGHIQGGLAEVMRDAMLQIEQDMPGRLLLQVHDSVVLELPKSEAEAQAEHARQVLISTYEKAFRVPFDAESARWQDKR